jgi:MFS family permease
MANVQPVSIEAAIDDSVAPLRRSSYRYVILAMLLLVYTLSYVDRQIIGILSIPIKTELNLSDTQLGLLGGFTFAVFYTALGIPIARLADTANRARIIAVSLALWSVFTALCGAAGSFPLLLLARLGVGVGEAGGVAPSYSLLSDYFPPRERGRVIGLYSLGVPIGSAAGLFLGGYLAQHYGWRLTFVFLGVLGVLLTPLFMLLVRETKRGAFDPPHEATSRAGFLQVLRHLKSKPAFWVASIATGFGSMMSYGLGFWMPSYVQRSLHLDLTQTAWLLGGTTLVGGTISMFGSGWLADKLGLRSIRSYALIPCFGCLATLVCLILAVNVTSIAATLVVLLGVYVFSQAYAPPTIALVQSLAPAHMRATTSAIFLLILNVMGLGLGPLAFGAVSDSLTASFGQGALGLAIVICGLVFYLAAALLFVIESRILPAGPIELFDHG